MLAVAVGQCGGVELKCGADHNCNMLPDINEPSNARHLKCGACQLAAVQLAQALIKHEASLKKKMAPEDGVELLERFCERGGLCRMTQPRPLA